MCIWCQPSPVFKNVEVCVCVCVFAFVLLLWLQRFLTSVAVNVYLGLINLLLDVLNITQKEECLLLFLSYKVEISEYLKNPQFLQ